jgi:hypothetical protein
MSDISEILRKYKPNVRDITIRKYTNDVQNIAKGIGKFGDETYEWVYDVPAVMDYLKDMAVMSRQSRLTGLRVFIQALGDKRAEAVLQEYEPFYKAAMDGRDEHYRNGAITEKQAVNRREYSEIVEDANRVIKRALNKEASYTDRRDAIIAALYTMQPPLRRDYVDMDWIKKPEYSKLTKEERESKNWYVRQAAGKAKMYLNLHKTAKSLGQVVIDVPTPLAKLMDKFIDASLGRQPILGFSGSKASTREKGKRFTAQELTSRMVHLLGSTINNLRSVYVTEKVVNKEQVKKDEETARAMLHSTSAQRGFYAKSD